MDFSGSVDDHCRNGKCRCGLNCQCNGDCSKEDCCKNCHTGVEGGQVGLSGMSGVSAINNEPEKVQENLHQEVIEDKNPDVQLIEK